MPSAATRPSIGREISRCLKELRQLRKEALAACTDEPESVPEKEPKHPPAANDDAAAPARRRPGWLCGQSRNEPDHPADPASPEVWTIDGMHLLDAWGRPRQRPLAVARELAEPHGDIPPLAAAAD